MKQAKRAGLSAASVRRVIAATFVLTMACSSEEGGDDRHEVTCEGDTCAQNAPAVDWKSGSPRYDAHVHVVTTAGDPVKGAVVKSGDKTAATDEKGNAVLTGLDATVETALDVQKQGSTPQVKKASAWTSARTPQTVVVAPLDVDKDVNPKERMVHTAQTATLDVPARALANAMGSRAESAHLALSFMAGDEPTLLPGSGQAVDRAGAPTLIERLGGVLYVHFSDTQGQKLNLAPGQTASIEMPVSAALEAKDGEVMPLWSLDERTGEWRKEKTCTVLSRMAGGSMSQVCQGVVDHFSFWAFGREIDIFQPGSVGCLNVTAQAERDACFKVNVLSMHTLVCDEQGESCTLDAFRRERFLPEPPDVAWCGVLPTGSRTYRSVVVYDTDASGCTGDIVSGRRSKVSDALDLASFQDQLGSDVMLNFTLRGDRDCATLCAQVPLRITSDDLEAPPFVDADADGAFALVDPALDSLFPLDCDDSRPDVRPFAPEPFCVLEDRNCDGRVQKDFAKHTDIEPGLWNRDCGVCKGIRAATLPLSDEAPKNLYDEDCDGVVLDADGDGKNWPEDCNDYDARVYPGAKEVMGNPLDEDCDGIALDWDGDGEFSPAHVHLAAARELDMQKFVDCNDFDPSVKTSADIANEVGALAGYYRAEGDTLRRSVFFCELFEQSGAPSFRFPRVARDLDCNGVVSDLDGDGFTVPGDLSLGEGKDLDCDDYDPRVRPKGVEDPTCEAQGQLLDDSVCNVPSQRTGDACPVLTLNGTDIVTVCEETKNADGTGTGLGACAFPGWWDGNPLVINPGSDWGPCDGESEGAPLPACPAGSGCGGELPYSEPFSQYLESTYLEGADVFFRGMCFPSCTPPK